MICRRFIRLRHRISNAQIANFKGGFIIKGEGDRDVPRSFDMQRKTLKGKYGRISVVLHNRRPFKYSTELAVRATNVCLEAVFTERQSENPDPQRNLKGSWKTW